MYWYCSVFVCDVLYILAAITYSINDNMLNSITKAPHTPVPFACAAATELPTSDMTHVITGSRSLHQAVNVINVDATY